MQGCRAFAPTAFTLQDIDLVLISFVGWVDPWALVQPEVLNQRKIPITPSGIEPATFRIVAQSLNHLDHRIYFFSENGMLKTEVEG